MSAHDTITLKVPRQELDHSCFFGCDEHAVAQWVSELPMANLGQTTRKLYQALSELNRVRLAPATRMALLEQLRTPIYHASRGLAKHYLNQPIVLPEQARKVAELADTLHTQLATGFTIVAAHTAALGKRLGAAERIATALHRAISDYTLNIQRHYQLYQPVGEGVWHKLHQFYSLAKQQAVLTKIIDDSECGNSSVQDCYVRALLMGCCNPNQLRQEDFVSLFAALTDWAGLCQLDTGDGLFVIDTDSDRPPVYRELSATAPSRLSFNLNTRALVAHLNKLQRDATANHSTLDDGHGQLAADLLGQLARSWGNANKRTFMRLASTDRIELCIGLSATHHFVSGELSFEALVEERGARTFAMQQENLFLKAPQHCRQKDVWDSPYEANVGQTSVAIESVDYEIRSNELGEQTPDNDKYHSHRVQIVNASAHGYCLAWPEHAKAHLKTGEIVGIKESQSHNWNIAVIRWVSHENNQRTQLGLELISPGASPYGARIIHKTGIPAEYMRVLVLPEIPATQSPMTLLTPRVPFRSGQKVLLNQRAKEIQIQLGNRLNQSGAFNQFEFQRVCSPAAADSEDSNPMDDFDSLWGSL